MSILSVVNSPWAITPDKLLEIRDIYATHLRGEKIDIKGLEARMGGELANKPQGYEVINGTAVIPLQGVIAKKMNMFQQVSGGVSTQMFERDVLAAVDDPDVDRLLVDVDSPGGTVDGTENAANVVYGVRGKKPIITYADGLMASAAVWIGTASDKVYISNATTQVGSIGVVSTHLDRSGELKNQGVVATEIYSGKYKRLVSEYKPLSKEGRESMQEHMNYLYSIFIEAVAKYRGADVETVLSQMADGRMFIGTQAIEAGLVDDAVSLQQILADVASEPDTVFEISNDINPDVEGEMPEITLDMIKESHPDIVKALRDEGADSIEDRTVAAEKAGDAERARIQGVLEMSLPGHEELINKLAFDGKTTPEQAAILVLKAEKSSVDHSVSQIEADAADLAEVAPSVESVVDVEALPDGERAKAKWDRDPALRQSFSEDFEAFKAYENAMSNGQVRILGGRK